MPLNTAPPVANKETKNAEVPTPIRTPKETIKGPFPSEQVGPFPSHEQEPYEENDGPQITEDSYD